MICKSNIILSIAIFSIITNVGLPMLGAWLKQCHFSRFTALFRLGHTFVPKDNLSAENEPAEGK